MLQRAKSWLHNVSAQTVATLLVLLVVAVFTAAVGWFRAPRLAFGDWVTLDDAVTGGNIMQAETDGFLLAYSSGNTEVAAFWLETGSERDRLVNRSRGSAYEGAMTPVKQGEFYRIRIRTTDDERPYRGGHTRTITAYWMPLR